MKQTSLKKFEKGFSLIELVVVLGIFLIVIGVAISIFISVLSQQKRILVEQELLNQTSYVMQYLSDALRMADTDKNGNCLGQQGYVYVLTHCNDISLTCSGVKFINTLDNNACEEVFLDTTLGTQNPTLAEIKDKSAKQNILSEKFQIQHMIFAVDGDKTLRFASSYDAKWPRISFLLDVKTQNPGNQQEKILQTTVSQRNFNQ